MELDKETLRDIFVLSQKKAYNEAMTFNWRTAWKNLAFAADSLHAMLVRKEIIDAQHPVSIVRVCSDPMRHDPHGDCPGRTYDMT